MLCFTYLRHFPCSACHLTYMDREKYRAYLLSPEWGEFRKKVFAHYGRKCSKCPRTKQLDIHHLTYENIFNEKLEDVTVLCRKHHAKVHGIKLVEVKKTKALKRTHISKETRFEFAPKRKKKKKDKRVVRVKNYKPIKTDYPIVDAIAANKKRREQQAAMFNN